MPNARPFAYNTGSLISGTEQVGDLAIGFPTSGFASTGLEWWNGPDEDTGYVICVKVPTDTQPTPVPGVSASVGFYKSKFLTEESFLDLAKFISQKSNDPQNFVDGSVAKTWLNSNGYWTSYTEVYKYNSSSFLSWPDSSTGYTLYTGGFTNPDDGFSTSSITLPVVFETNNQSSDKLYLSTNGYFTLGSGDGGIYGSPQNANPATMAANPGDNWMQPGLTNSDGDVQNWYYKTGNDGGQRYYAKLLVYGGTYGAQTTPTSYVINFYRDSVYQWLETRVKSNTRGSAGPYNAVDVSQGASMTSKVWRGDLNGQNWVYMGTGTVVI